MQRRTFMKAVGVAGAAGAAGVGLQSLTGTAAGATVSITATKAEVSNDRGLVSRVTADPGFDLSWDGFDDAVGKVFYLVEASVAGGDFQPLFRATPWLSAADIGTSGTLSVRPSLSQALNQDDRFDSVDYSAGPLIIADEQGRPNYEDIDFSSIGGVTLESFLDGTSMGGADNYPAANVEGGHQNNYPAIDAGYYGAASDTEPFHNPNDDAGTGSTSSTSVTLRYTFELQRPNLSQLKYRVDMSNYGDGTSSWKDLTTAEKKAFAADQIDGLRESDIDTGNSKLVMNGEDGLPSFETPSGISYQELRNNTNHPGIVVETAQFNVEVTNEGSGTSGGGESGTGAS